jgi:hypothetical protein
MLSIDPRNYSQDSPQSAIQDLSPLERFWLFAEHAITLTVISIVVSLLTIFIDARWFVSLAGVSLLALHRSKALQGKNLALQLFVNITVFCGLAFLLWPMGQHVNESRDEAVDLLKALELQSSQKPPQPSQQRAETTVQPADGRKSDRKAPSPKAAIKNVPEQSPAPGSNSKELEAGKPILVILPDTLKAPSIPLGAVSPATSLFISVINRGSRSAQHTFMNGRLMFARGIDALNSMKEECEHPPTQMYPDGPSIGPQETKPLLSGFKTDYPGLEKQLLDPTRNGEVQGYLIGCITYHDDLIERPLHSAFVLDVGFSPRSDRSQQVLKDFREHGHSNPNNTQALPFFETFYKPDLISPYYY